VDGTRGSCHNMSVALSKSVIPGERIASEAGLIDRMQLKTLTLFPEGI